MREAQAAAAITHDHVINIHTVEDAGRVPYLVMKFIDGPTLQQKLDCGGPLPLREVLRIGQQIAAGLAAAHARGLVHRDVKPANILLENAVEQVKITDFGLARAGDDASLTQTGVIAGTPDYMSPEQAHGARVDPRSDLFSLGSVLYTLCAGQPPFRASSTMAILRRVCEGTPRPLREVNPDIPEPLCRLIEQLHAKKPDDRPASAQEVADQLARLLAGLSEPGTQRSGVSGPAPAGPLTPLRCVRGSEARGPGSPEALVLVCVGLGLGEATGVTNVRGTVIRLFSPQGTLVVEVDDPGVSVAVDGGELVITGAGVKEIRLKSGQHKVEASKDGKLVRQELVTITHNGRQVVRVSQEPVAVPKAASAKKDPDRHAAEYVLSIGGTIRRGEDRFVRAVADLPQEPFRLTHFDLEM